MKLKNFFLFIILIHLVACQNGNEPNHRNSNKAEVFFENIYVGDKLESCLAKGAVQFNIDYNAESSVQEQKNMLELANNNVASPYFSFAGVWFDNNNIINRIELKFHQKENGKTAKEVFNFMTQYFCQRYQGMKTETVAEEWEHDADLKFNKEGFKNIWETNKVKIILQFYDNSLIHVYSRIKKDPIIHSDENRIYRGKHIDFGEIFWSEKAKEHIGYWVEVNILAK